MSVTTEATQWKAVMEFANGERNYAFAGTANKTSGSVHTKTTKRKTFPGWTPPSESFAGSVKRLC
ncbi:MAG: hypothetical protein IJG38_14555 [Thermoguttaceae bacterium]|nr:hypothetical protein [Thermoguttaceae bacterium]